LAIAFLQPLFGLVGHPLEILFKTATRKGVSTRYRLRVSRRCLCDGYSSEIFWRHRVTY